MSADGRLGIWVLVGALVLFHLLLHVGFGLGREAPDLLTIGLLLAARELGLGAAAALGLNVLHGLPYQRTVACQRSVFGLAFVSRQRFRATVSVFWALPVFQRVASIAAACLASQAQPAGLSQSLG